MCFKARKDEVPKNIYGRDWTGENHVINHPEKRISNKNDTINLNMDPNILTYI